MTAGARILARAGYQAVSCTTDPASTVIVGAGPRTGNLDVLGDGGSVYVRDGNMGAHRLTVRGPFDRAEVRNVRSDGRDVAARDGIFIDGRVARLLVTNSRVEGIHGTQDGVHGDGIQIGDDADADLVWVRDTTICSAYQGLMLANVRRVVLERVNISDEPGLRSQKSIVVFFKGAEDYDATLEIRNCYLDGWPDGLERAVRTTGRVKVIGAFQQGLPPGGDFCPA